MSSGYVVLKNNLKQKLRFIKRKYGYEYECYYGRLEYREKKIVQKLVVNIFISQEERVLLKLSDLYHIIYDEIHNTVSIGDEVELNFVDIKPGMISSIKNGTYMKEES